MPVRPASIRPAAHRARVIARPFAPLLLTLCALLAPSPGVAQEVRAGVAQDVRAGAVDALFQRWHTPDSPGAAVLVMQDGVVVHARGYGMANLEHGVPIRTNTVFDIASISKQFGALAIALLEADGLVALDDDVRRYIPELPDFGAPITLRHLVHHTSGLRDWPGTLRIAGWDYQDVISFEQILRMAYQQRELNFEPGSAYAYSNTGYNLLAEVVQRVTGQSFRAWTDARIFRPLGMRDTHFHDDHTRVVRNRAASYHPAPDGAGAYHNIANNLTALASSSLFTTVEDLGRWLRNFDEPVVGDARLIARLHERGVLTGGDTIAYAFGLIIGEYRGLRTVSHGGSWAGYRTSLLRVPDAGLDVVVLANTTELNAGALAQRIADIYLGDHLAPAPLASGAAAAAAGAGGGTVPAERWAPAAAELDAYAGRYESAELLTGWSLARRAGRLVASHFRNGDVTLQPVEPDRFQAPLFGTILFMRDDHGRIAGFTANSDRVRGLRFERME